MYIMFLFLFFRRLGFFDFIPCYGIKGQIRANAPDRQTLSIAINNTRNYLYIFSLLLRT